MMVMTKKVVVLTAAIGSGCDCAPPIDALVEIALAPEAVAAFVIFHI
jgi:hypothetical protein